MIFDECAGDGMYLPTNECDDCDGLFERVSDLEQDKQDNLIAGTGITLENNVISADAASYVAGENININGQVISAVDTKYTAGQNISINGNIISAPDVYNKTEVDDLLSDLEHIRMEVVDALPATGEPNVIYLLDDGLGNYEQWVYTQTDGWIDLGGEEVDLSNYYTKTQADALLANKQNKLTAGDNITITGSTISATDTKYTGTSPITVSGTTISHANSGVTAGTKGTNNTTALTPGFGDTFNVIGMAVNATGHVTSANSHTVKIPNTAATTSAAGLMSAADKEKLARIGRTISPASTGSISIPANTVRTIATITLSKGYWLIEGFCDYQGGDEGYRQMCVTNSPTQYVRIPGTVNTYCYPGRSHIYSEAIITPRVNNDDTVYYLNVRSEQAFTVEGKLTAICIG